VLISFWLYLLPIFIFAAQLKEFALDGLKKLEQWPRHSSSGWSLASHRGDPGSNPGSSHVGFVVDKVAVGQVFSEYFGFFCQIFIPPISTQSPSPIIQGGYNRPVVAAVPKVPPHKLKKN
jgi:hypothetical protein